MSGIGESTLRIFALCGLCIGLSWPAGAARHAGQTAARIFDVTTALGITDSKPARPTALFTADDEAIVVWYRAEGCGIGTTITSDWYYLDTTGPVRIAEGGVTVSVLDDWGQFTLTLAPDSQWKIGDHRVELGVGGVLLAQTTFRVAESTSRKSAIAAMLWKPWGIIPPGTDLSLSTSLVAGGPLALQFFP
jgi:hypothetical protein